jgi:predicted ribosomally synthesized peptide with SipW-like signal peptide
MNKKLLLIIFAVVLAAGLIGGGIMAWFTASDSVEGNTFTAGTLVMNVYSNGMLVTGDNNGEVKFTFANIYPGWEGTWVVKLDNVGSLPFKYAVSAGVTGRSYSEEGYKLEDYIRVEYRGGDYLLADVLANQPLFAGTRDAGEEGAEYTVRFYMPETTGNEAQGLALELKLDAVATQLADSTEYKSLVFIEGEETPVSFASQGVDMKVKAGEDSNTVISIERYDSDPADPPAGKDPAGIYLEISADPPLPEGSEVVLEVSYAHLLPLPEGFVETALQLFHFNDVTGEWEDITEVVDTVNNKIISKPITSFSVFGIFCDLEKAVVDAALAEVNNVPKPGEPYTFEEDIDAPFLLKPIKAGDTTQGLSNPQVQALLLHALRKNKDVLGLDFTGFDALGDDIQQLLIAYMLDFMDGRPPAQHPEIEAGPFKSAEDLRVIFDWYVIAFSNL